jgi:AraC-like DNA-binding protein
MWRSIYDPFNRIDVPDEADATGFTARNEIWPLGGLALMRNLGPAIGFERSARHIRRDSVDHWVIRLALSGRSRFRSGATSVVAEPSSLLLFSLGEPFDGDRSDSDWVSLYIPRDGFPELSAGLGLVGPGLLRSPGAGLLADYIASLQRRLPGMTASQGPMLIEATRSMVAACLLTGLDRRIATPRDLATAQLERVRGIIRQNIASPSLAPRKICRLAGISRSQLYRLFEPHGGVARYVRGMRLRMAHAMLADPALSRLAIGAVAERTGFYDASAFSRVFQLEFGYAPREARAAARSGVPPRATAFGAAPVERTPGDFRAVLRRLSNIRPARRPPDRPGGALAA